MKKLRSLICVVIAMLLIVLPLSVSATGESEVTSSEAPSSDIQTGTEPQEPFALTLECKVNGSVPKDTVFTFGVTSGDYVWDTVENTKAIDDFVIDTKTAADGKMAYPFPETAAQGGVYYKFVLSSVSNTLVRPDPIEVEVYFAETGVKAEILKDGLPIDEYVDEPVTVTFNCTTAAEVKISTDGCDAVSKVYDGKLDAAVTDKNYKLTGVVEGHDVKLSFEKAEFNSADVKMASKVTASGLKLIGADADKYALSVDKFEVKGNVTPRPLTVTADDLVMTVGQDEPELTYKLSEALIEGNEAVGAPAKTAGSELGTYAITIGTLSFGDNYDVTFIDGSLTISSFSYAEIKDAASLVKVTGYFDPGATLKVSALDPASAVYASLAAGTSWGKIVSSYDIMFTSADTDGVLVVSIPVDAKYEGKEFAVYQMMTSGTISCYKTVALGGVVTVTTGELTQFMLVTDKDAQPKEEGSAAMTVLKVIIIILAVIIGLALLVALFFFGMIFFNKTEQLKAIIKALKRLFKK